MLDAQNSAKEVESTKGASQGRAREGEMQGWAVQCGDAGLLGLAHTA